MTAHSRSDRVCTVVIDSFEVGINYDHTANEQPYVGAELDGCPSAARVEGRHQTLKCQTNIIVCLVTCKRQCRGVVVMHR